MAKNLKIILMPKLTRNEKIRTEKRYNVSHFLFFVGPPVSSVFMYSPILLHSLLLSSLDTKFATFPVNSILIKLSSLNFTQTPTPPTIYPLTYGKLNLIYQNSPSRLSDPPPHPHPLDLLLHSFSSYLNPAQIFS